MLLPYNNNTISNVTSPRSPSQYTDLIPPLLLAGFIPFCPPIVTQLGASVFPWNIYIFVSFIRKQSL